MCRATPNTEPCGNLNGHALAAQLAAAPYPMPQPAANQPHVSAPTADFPSRCRVALSRHRPPGLPRRRALIPAATARPATALQPRSSEARTGRSSEVRTFGDLEGRGDRRFGDSESEEEKKREEKKR